MKMKRVASWKIKGSQNMDRVYEMLEKAMGSKLRAHQVSSSMGSVQSLPNGRQILDILYPSFVTFGIWLERNNLIEDIKKEEIEKTEETAPKQIHQSMFG